MYLLFVITGFGLDKIHSSRSRFWAATASYQKLAG